MRRLYHEDIGPDGQVLGRRQRKANYPEASGSLYKRVEDEVAFQRAERGRFFTPEEERALRLRLRSAYRTVVPLYDLTYSAPKSVSVLWASLLAASAEAEAEGREADAERFAERAAQVRGAVKRANDRMIAVAERELAYVRTGHHSQDARGSGGTPRGSSSPASSSTTRATGCMQLHVHNAIANRAQRADGARRALAGAPRAPAVPQQAAARDAGRPVPRPGAGADRLPGRAPRGRDGDRGRRDQRRGRGRVQHPEQGTAGQRARARGGVRARARPRSGQAGQVGDQAAGRLWRRGTPRITTRLRPAQQVAAWARKAERSGIGALSALHEAAEAYSAEHEPSSAAERGGAGADHPQGRRRDPGRSTPRSTGRS